MTKRVTLRLPTIDSTNEPLRAVANRALADYCINSGINLRRTTVGDSVIYWNPKEQSFYVEFSLD